MMRDVCVLALFSAAILYFVLFVYCHLRKCFRRWTWDNCELKLQLGNFSTILLILSEILVLACPRYLSGFCGIEGGMGDVAKILVHVCSLLSFIVQVMVGGYIVYFSCKGCLCVAKIIRLWLHRRISRISFAFAIVACCVMIALPFLVCALISALFDVSIGRWIGLGGTSDAVVKSYFYAICDGVSVRDLALGIETWYIFLGLIGYLVFSGFTVSMFVSMIQKKMERITNGEEHYPDMKSHYVVIGSGVLLESVVERISEEHKEDKQCNIVILSSEPIPELRKRLDARLRVEYMERLVFVHGDRTNKEDLQQLALASCKEIYLLGDFGTADQDDRNLVSLNRINKILADRSEDKKACCRIGRTASAALCAAEENVKSGKKCRIYLERYHTYGLFQSYIKETRLEHLEVEPICFYKQWAEVVLGIRNVKNENIVTEYPPFDRVCAGPVKGDGKQAACGGIAPESENYVHLVVIGMSRMGMSLVTEAAQLLHFPNSRRTRITMIDTQARREMYKFVNLHSSLFAEAYHTYTEFEDVPFGGKSFYREKNAETGWLDVEFHFIQGNAECEDVRRRLADYAQDSNACLTIAVCLPDARRALSLGLSLPRNLYNRNNVNILIQQEVGEGLLNLLNLQERNVCPYTNVRPFGMLNASMDNTRLMDNLIGYPHLFYEACCCQVHDSWDSLYKNLVERNLKKGEYKNPSEMELWRQISNRYAAASCDFKRRSFGLTGDFVADEKIIFAEGTGEAHGRTEHNRWCVEKLITGYRALTEDEKHKMEEGIAGYSWKELRAQFAHDGIRKWDEITSNPSCASYKFNSINMGRGICFLRRFLKES